MQAIVYEENDGKEKLLASTSGSSNSLSLTLKGRDKAYHLKLVYNARNSKNNCVLYDLQVAMKPLMQVASENLLCEGYEIPPELYNISEPFFKTNRKFALSGQYLV